MSDEVNDIGVMRFTLPPTKPGEVTEVVELDMSAIGARESMMVRQATNFPWSYWVRTVNTNDLRHFDLDTMAVFIWVAKVRAGDFMVSLDDVYPIVATYAEWNQDDPNIPRVKVEWVTGDDIEETATGEARAGG